MRLRRFAWVLAFGSVAVGVAWVTPGCSSKSSGLGLAAGCSLNSDCDDPLVCIFSLCHQECASSRDCPSGEACVATTSGYGICQLPGEADCMMTTQCKSGEVCGQDDKCRAPCMSANNCLMDQLCIQQVCYDPGELDGGESSSSGGDGGAGDGGRSDGGASEGGGDSGPACATAETQFGPVVQGDSNPSFTGGIGIRTATQLLVFDGYQGPPPGGPADGGTVNYIYAQAFDPATGASQGPASPFLAGQVDTAFLYPEAAAVAPTGEIILLYYSSGTGLWASFLTDTADADAGTSGLKVQKSFQISTTLAGQAHAYWSPASKAFVVSNVYSGNLMKVQKFLPNGDNGGTSTDPVPTDNAGASVSGYYNEGVASSSNGLLGVAYVNAAQSRATMTVLDGQGNQVGSAFPLVTTNTSAWVTLGGTSAGFVGFFDEYQTGGVGEVLVPVASDGGIPAAFAGDAGDAGAFQGFLFPGTKAAVYALSVNDDVGGVGGVGAAFLYEDSIAFAYVNADGITHVGPASLISHTYTNTDYIHLNNAGGSFGVSLYSGAAHATQVSASVCTP